MANSEGLFCCFEFSYHAPMAYPNLAHEKKYWAQGYGRVAGLDEAGRGPLAGPVVAAAVMMRSPKHRIPGVFTGLHDSKKISEKKREYFYRLLVSHPDIEWGIGVVSEKIIDEINILQATKLAMRQALAQLGAGYDILLIDGNMAIADPAPQISIIRGDQQVFSIAAASIIAKVSRDSIMRQMDKRYPVYGFAAHKGYGTSLHLKKLQAFGPSPIHRKTFYPMNSL
jgi:ribonuclease HII